MFNVGFIEEIIFRGFLFKMMAKDNVKSAVIVRGTKVSDMNTDTIIEMGLNI